VHVDPLLGNDREITNYTMSATRQRPEDGSLGREQFRNPEDVNRPLLEDATKQRLAKTVPD
jgi:hypothetical protein